MYSAYMNERYDFSNLAINYPSGTDEEEQNPNFKDEKIIIKNIFNTPNPPEFKFDELGTVIEIKEPSKPKKKRIFLIKKKENKINKPKPNSETDSIEIIKNFESNGVKHPLNQIFNSSKEVTKENSNINCVIKKQQEDKFTRKKRKRSETEKNNNEDSKRKRPDNCRLKIGRHFFNSFLIFEIINSLIQGNGPNLYFERFPQKFIHKATKKKNKEYLKMSLEKILTDKELYEEDEKKEDGNFMHNLNALHKLKSNFDCNNIFEKSKLNDYLEMTYKELYEEYSKSYRYKKLEELVESKADYEEFQELSEYKTFIDFFKK